MTCGCCYSSTKHYKHISPLHFNWPLLVLNICLLLEIANFSGQSLPDVSAMPHTPPSCLLLPFVLKTPSTLSLLPLQIQDKLTSVIPLWENFPVNPDLSYGIFINAPRTFILQHSFLFLWLVQCCLFAIFPGGFCSAYLPVAMALSPFLLFVCFFPLPHQMNYPSHFSGCLMGLVPVSLAASFLSWLAFTTHILDFQTCIYTFPAQAFSAE